MSEGLVLVAGAGGFIGGHLVRSLVASGYSVRAVDIKPLHDWFQISVEAENICADLRTLDACRAVSVDVDEVYNLAADMGGMGFIANNRALCMLSVLINTHLLMAASERGVQRYFYASSACVYAAQHQDAPEIVPLCEDQAYPAMPEDGYGWEKLFGERMCRHVQEDFGLETRVARFHNVYGPQGTWRGGREKAPAAICRKVAEAEILGRDVIEIWGDGHQTRSFAYIDDCVFGAFALMRSEVDRPLNIGSNELVTIDELVDIVENIAGLKLHRRYDLSAAQGVRGRNSDNTLIQKELGWQPSTPLRSGLEVTYRWIRREVERATERGA
jgi:GDP-D-mannose 3', 5'-epimerase